MVRDELKLSQIGYRLYDRAVEKTREKIKKYGNVRTRFYYPVGDGTEINHADLREVIDSLMQEFNLKFPFSDKKSPYAQLVNNKAFEVFNMKILRISPNNYIIVVHRERDSKLLFIIRDNELHPDSNIKVEWDGPGLDKGKVEKISLHINKQMLDLE